MSGQHLGTHQHPNFLRCPHIVIEELTTPAPCSLAKTYSGPPAGPPNMRANAFMTSTVQRSWRGVKRRHVHKYEGRGNHRDSSCKGSSLQSTAWAAHCGLLHDPSLISLKARLAKAKTLTSHAIKALARAKEAAGANQSYEFAPKLETQKKHPTERECLHAL